MNKLNIPTHIHVHTDTNTNPHASEKEKIKLTIRPHKMHTNGHLTVMINPPFAQILAATMKCWQCEMRMPHAPLMPQRAEVGRR